MKKLYLLLTFLLICGVAWGAPTSTTTRPHSYSTGSTVDADEQNSNENTIYNAYNVHTHEDLTKTSSTAWTLGANTDVDHRFIADNGDSNNPELRYESDESRWEYSNDGSTFNAMITTGGTGTLRGDVDGFDMSGASGNFVTFGAGSVAISSVVYNTTGLTKMSVASEEAWIGGSTSDNVDTWIYNYVHSSDSAANIASFKFSTVAPNAVDESSNTGGVNKFYTVGGTTYRCIGAVRNNANSDIASFNVSKNTVMWSKPVEVTTTVVSSIWTGLDCSAAIPAISEMGEFGLYVDDNSATRGIWIQASGSSWTANTANGIYFNSPSGSYSIGGQRSSATDSSQQIEYRDSGDNDAIAISVEGYVMQMK